MPKDHLTNFPQIDKTPARPACMIPPSVVPCGAYTRIFAINRDMLAMLEMVEDYLDDREDVVDGSYGVPAPNAEMQLLSVLRPMLARARGAS